MKSYHHWKISKGTCHWARSQTDMRALNMGIFQQSLCDRETQRGRFFLRVQFNWIWDLNFAQAAKDLDVSTTD